MGKLYFEVGARISHRRRRARARGELRSRRGPVLADHRRENAMEPAPASGDRATRAVQRRQAGGRRRRRTRAGEPSRAPPQEGGSSFRQARK